MDSKSLTTTIVNATSTTPAKTMVSVNYSAVGYPCPETNRTYELVVYVSCNKNVPKELAVPKIISSPDQCRYEILLEVDKGCPMVDLSMFWGFINRHLALFAIGFIILGIIIGAFGRSMWTTIIFLLFAITITSFFLVIFYEYVLPFNTPEWLLWFILILSAGMGISAAYFAARYQAAGFILLGTWLGASFTIVFENIVIRALVAGFLVWRVWYTKERTKGIILGVGLLGIPSIYVYYANTYTFWLCLIGTSALCGAIAYYVKDLLTTLATAFIGAYLSVRGLALAIGKFPNEYEIYQQIRSGNVEVQFFRCFFRWSQQINKIVFKRIDGLCVCYTTILWSICVCTRIFEQRST